MTLRPPLNPITADLYMQMPEGPPYYELIEGNLVLHPQPGPHDRLQLPLNPVTTEFYDKMPEGPPYYQLIEGHLIMSPSPDFFHQQILSYLHLEIGLYLRTNPIGILALAPSDVRLTRANVFQPDLYFVRNENRRVIKRRGAVGPPDLVIEILSPSNSAFDRHEKRRIYGRAGVTEMWMVEPRTRMIEVHTLSKGLDAAPTIIRAPETFSPSIFPGLKIDTQQLFKPLD